MRIPQSKRLRFAIIITAINFAIGIATLLIDPTALVAMGTFLLMSNSPFYIYIFGETFRPSSGVIPPPKEDNEWRPRHKSYTERVIQTDEREETD